MSRDDAGPAIQTRTPHRNKTPRPRWAASYRPSRLERTWLARHHDDHPAAYLLRTLDEVRALGYDERFLRIWRFYLTFCEAAFRVRTLRDVQLVLARPRAEAKVGSPVRRDKGQLAGREL